MCSAGGYTRALRTDNGRDNSIIPKLAMICNANLEVPMSHLHLIIILTTLGS